MLVLYNVSLTTFLYTIFTILRLHVMSDYSCACSVTKIIYIYLMRAFCVLTESTNACCPSKKNLIWSSVLTSSVRINQCINVFYCISSCQQLAEQNTIAISDIILWYFSFSFLSKVSNCVCFQAATNQSGWKQLITISLVLETIDLMGLLDVILYIEQVCWYKYTRHNMFFF